MDEQRLRAALKTTVAGLHYFESIGSTNDLALQLAAQGAADGTLVVADQQTMGRGRLERRWVTAPGAALAFSLALRPTPAEQQALALFAPLCGLAVSRALEALGLQPQIKWPNDVLLERRKTCGILVEAQWQGARLQGLVAGIGVNVAPSSVPPAEELRFPATCIETVLGRPVDRVELLSSILRYLYEERARLGSPEFFSAWESRLAFRGEWVNVQQPGQELKGRVLGISPTGSLRLASPDGTPFEVEAGDLSLRPVG